MAGKLSKFQTIGFTGWMGLTSDNHLGAMFQRQPQRATDIMIQLLAYNRGNTLETFLNQFPTKEFDDDTEYYWDVLGSSRRNIPLIEARREDGATVVEAEGNNVGVGGSDFYLVFPEDWFPDGTVIGGNLNEAYPIRVKGSATFEGTNAVYKCELMGGITDGIPAERLQAGERFSIEYTPVETEMSRKVGDIHFTTPVSMRNEWTTIRMSHKVAGNKMNRKLAFGIPMIKEGPDGKQIHDTATMWMHYVDWQFECEWQDQKNTALAFGRSNRNANGEYLNFGKSGNVIRMGAGIFEQAEVANTMYYNDTHDVMKLILNALSELSEGKLNFKDRKFIINTGERGAMLFNREAKRETSGWMPLFTNSDQNPAAVSRTTSKFAPNNAVKITDFQVTEWQAPNGVYVKLNVDPFYDDKVRNKILHPEGGVAFSYRFDIWYIGASEDTPNIQKAAIKGEPEIRGYESGFRNPFTGQRNINNMSHAEDSATVHKMATFGSIVYDPTRTMAIIPSILAS